MQVSKDLAVGMCGDCGQRIKGSLTVSIYDCQSDSYGMATGSLPSRCAKHHDKNRVWGAENAPKHSDFLVTEGQKRLGTMRVATMTSEMPFYVEDREMMRTLREDGRRFARERGLW